MKIKKYLFKEISLNQLNSRWLIFILKIASYAGLSAYLLSISWQAWPDILIDYGEEIYAAWRITEGDVFYRDINYHYIGPLSYYLNALWFYLFGVGIKTLVVINLLLLILLVFLLEDWLKTISNKLSAFIAISFFLAVFAFGRYMDFGNYNYITPYTSALTYGLILTLALFYCLKKWPEKNNLSWIFLSGILIGLTILTKIEISIPAISAVTIYSLAISWSNIYFHKNLTKNIFILLGGIAIPPIITVFVFSLAMPIDQAATGIFSQWLTIINGRFGKINSLLFYKIVSGINDPVSNLIKMLNWSLIYFNFILVGSLGALFFKEMRRWRISISALIILSLIALNLIFLPIKTWLQVIRPLPIVMLLGLTWSLQNLLKYHKNKFSENSDNLVVGLRLASFVFAGTMLIKMALNTRIAHYGFVLTMPAVMLLLVAITDWLPRYLKNYGAAWAFKALSVGTIISAAVSYIIISNTLYSTKDFYCCSTKQEDIIRTDSLRGSIIAETVHELDRRLKPNQTFAVVPRGMMLNYLLRRPNPTKHLSLIFDMILAYQEKDIEKINTEEQKIINSYINNTPDFIVFINLNTSEQGYAFFGKDYGINLYHWINENYRIVWSKKNLLERSDNQFETTLLEHI